MTQHDFDILSEKYLSGECSPEEELLLEKWTNVHYNNDYDVIFNKLNDSETEIENRIWSRIENSAEISKPKIWKLYQKISVGIAACLVLMATYYYTKQDNVTIISLQRKQGVESKNIAEKPQKVVLADGSTMMLEKNASIIVDENYGKTNRTVFLTGEAFFQVTRNEKKPFLVHSGNLVTEVLGTSFRIKPLGNSKKIDVMVRTGKVSVYANESKNNKMFNGVILTQNQKVTFDIENNTISQGIVDKPQLVTVNMPKIDFLFEDITVEKAAKYIQSAYGVEIFIANPNINQCLFTGDLNGLPMYRQLDIICGTVNAQYEIRGTVIFISGNGCK